MLGPSSLPALQLSLSRDKLETMHDFLQGGYSVNQMLSELFRDLSALPQVEAIALGGSRATGRCDETSDYDVYVYLTNAVAESQRRTILEKYCGYLEIGNTFWELEDDVTLKNGIDMDIIYRNLEDFAKGISSVVDDCNAWNGYTTCMWHNLLTCKILYDQDGRLADRKSVV